MSQPFLPNQTDAFDDIQAQPDSVDFDILTNPAIGVLSGCAVSEDPTTPDMTVDVASGTVIIKGTGVVVAAAANNTIATADGSNPRIDLVSTTFGGGITVTAGTAAAVPEAPAVPVNHVALAFVLVPASDTAITDAQIVDKRLYITNQAYISNIKFGIAGEGSDYGSISAATDALLIRVWDDTGSALRPALYFYGKNRSSDPGDIIFFSPFDNETLLTWDESADHWVFAKPVRANEASEDTGTIALDWTQAVLNCDTSGGAATVTLPDNADYSGKQYLIRRDGTNAVTINRAGTDTFDDAATSKTLGSDGASIGIFSIGDGEWKIVGTTGTVT